MTLPETHSDEELLPPSKSDGASNFQAAGCETAVLPAPAEPRWGLWATVGLSLVVLTAFVVVQTAVAIAFIVVQIAVSGHAPNDAEVASFTSNGLLLSLATLIAMPPSLALVVLFAKIKPGATIREYLGLQSVSFRVGLSWLCITLLYAAAVDG